MRGLETTLEVLKELGRPPAGRAYRTSSYAEHLIVPYEYQPSRKVEHAQGKAMHDLRGQWPYLARYLVNGRLEFSNNRAERNIRPSVMGRKNWLFANTPAGAQFSAVIDSLLDTAKEAALNRTAT